MAQTHVLFIDDSGTKEYATSPQDYNIGGRGNSRYFLFCGVLVSMGTSGILTNEIIQAKLRCFADDTVEIKSNWLRIPLEQQRRYFEPYGITADRLSAFTEEYYEIINNADLMLIASIVDKLQMQEDYPNPWYAPAVAYETMLLRVQQELLPSQQVAVIIDDTTGKTPKGNEYKKNLERQHNKLKKYGSALWKGKTFPSLTTQKFVNSQNSNLVQVADVCAYNVLRQFQMYGNEWEDSNCQKLPLFEYFAKIHTKFRQDNSGKIQGYGIIKMPQRKKIGWSI